MLLTKKNKFSVSEAQIKEDILSKDGELLLKINIRYPDIKCAKNDPLSKCADKFYKNLADAFTDFAKNELAKVALSAFKAKMDDFLPYSAVMRYEVTLENKDYLSVLIDLSVSDGINPPSNERKTQVWERKNGTKCRYTDFVPKKRIDVMIPEENKRHFDYELFVLREGIAEFFVKNTDGYSSLIAEREETDKK